MSNILLINEKRSKLDLSAVKDAEGKMIILQPKGAPGSSRECDASVLEHPHVQGVIQAKWARYEVIGVLAQAAPAPVPPPAEITGTPEVAPPVVPPPAPPKVEAAPEPPAEVSEPAVSDATPVVEEAPVEELATVEAVESNESTGSSSSFESRRKKRDRDR